MSGSTNLDTSTGPGGNAPYWTTQVVTSGDPPPFISGAPVYASTYNTATHSNAFSFALTATVGDVYSFGVYVWVPAGTSATSIAFRGDDFTSFTSTSANLTETGQWQLISGTGTATITGQPVVVGVAASVGAVIYFTAPWVVAGTSLGSYSFPASGEQAIGGGVSATTQGDSLSASLVDVIPSAIPPTHVPPALSLTPDAYVNFYTLQLYQGATINLCDDIDREWMGISWTGIGLTFAGYGMYGTSQVSRPTLKVLNPDGVFSAFVAQRQFDYGTLTRYRVLLGDVTANNPVYLLQNWVIARVQAASHTNITLELRSYLDTPNFTLPANQYSPPKFPMVTMP